MTIRQHKIIAAILNVLSNLDGGQMTEPVLHAEVNLHVTPTASLAEFEDARDMADKSGWLVGVPSKFGARKWSLSERGEAARLEMR